MTDLYIDPNPPGLITTIEEPSNRQSAVSWAAIFAGAAGAAALSLLLLFLGTGLGLTAVSPWASEGISAASFGFAAIAWLSFTQLAASGMGGYLAGRLRTKWTAVHSDEVYFRDTAHGFLTWAVASLLVAALLTSVVGAIINGGARAGAAGASAVMDSSRANSNEASSSLEYAIDSMFRDNFSAVQNRQTAGETAAIPVAEVTRIFTRALRNGTLPQEDKRYVSQLIVQRSDLSQHQAEQRVLEGFDNVQGTLKEATDEAREASAYVALWMFVALLLGAFTASLMAVYGGRQRDASIAPINY